MTTSFLHSSFQLSFRVENADTSEKKLKQMILEFLNNSDQNSDKSINISIKKWNRSSSVFVLRMLIPLKKLKQIILEILKYSDQNSDKLIIFPWRNEIGQKFFIKKKFHHIFSIFNAFHKARLEKWSKNTLPANSFWDLDAIHRRAKITLLHRCNYWFNHCQSHTIDNCI